MQIALTLRRKRDEIAATIVGYEAKIDAARRDLAGRDAAGRLFEPEAGHAETLIPWDLDGLPKPEELLAAPREANEQRAPGTGPFTPPVPRTQDLERQLTGYVARASTRTGPARIPAEFFYFDWP